MLGKHVPAATYTRRNQRIVGRVIFYAVCVLSKESLWACLCIPNVARQQLGKHVPAVTNTRNNTKIVGLVIFYAVCVLSPVTVAELSTACTVFACSETGIVGLNTIQGMDV
jgi:hypothetical protein